ncbi:oligosaccharide flippase family protein [Massilia sp. PWRC2]|uniref:oligosaccharide flippase family protein n=1 Tax=Massilia sp. PWRC2 TaxID=2804626 RepID=UPI003CF7688E
MDIRKSLVFSYLDRYASLIINIVSSMVIARMLTPADIGVFSVTVVLLTFIASIRDMGAGNYLVQEKEITIDRVRAVWAVQLGLGVLLALVVLAASVPVALFYKEPRMRDIMLVVALNYAINPFGSLTYAWQIREMRFDALAIVRFSATLAGAVVSIVCAWRGYGPISLAYGSLASTTVNAAMAVHYRPAWFPWLPGIKEIRRVLAFGSQTTGAAVIQNIAGNAPELLLAKLQSMTATGLYSRASGLILMFERLVLAGIGAVAVSWFAKQSRDHGDIAQPFIKATSYICAIGIAFSLGTIFLAHSAMRVLYGPQWDGAIELTRLLAVALAFSLPASMCNAALMATGGASRVLRGTAVTTVIAVILVTIGAYGGLTQMGVCLIISSAFRTIYWLQQTRAALGFAWSDLGSAVWKSTLVGMGAGVAPLLVYCIFGALPANIWWPLVFGVPGAFIGFVAMSTLVKHPIQEEISSALALIKQMVLRFVAKFQ